jgi:hypothetical protein
MATWKQVETVSEMRTGEPVRLIPIYTTRGDAAAFLAYPFLVNRGGEWIGWVSPERQVYSVLGHYVGYLSNDPRILRRRSAAAIRARKLPTEIPPKIYPPANVPLAPMMPELPQSIVDVLQEEPERLHTLDLGELRSDLD